MAFWTLKLSSPGDKTEGVCCTLNLSDTALAVSAEAPCFVRNAWSNCAWLSMTSAFGVWGKSGGFMSNAEGVSLGMLLELEELAQPVTLKKLKLNDSMKTF